jgi:hypothetical protein
MERGGGAKRSLGIVLDKPIEITSGEGENKENF